MPLDRELELRDRRRQVDSNRSSSVLVDGPLLAYFEVRGDDYFVDSDYVNGAIPLAGGYAIDTYGPRLLALYRRGDTATACDVAADEELTAEERAEYAALQIGAYIGVPLVEQGQLVAGLTAHSAGPRRWTPEDIALVEETAERTWAAVERARALTGWGQGQDKRKALDVGFDAHLTKPADPAVLARTMGDSRQEQLFTLVYMRDLACCTNGMAFHSTPSDLVPFALATNPGSGNGETAGSMVMSLTTERDSGLVIAVTSNMAHAKTSSLALRAGDAFAEQTRSRRQRSVGTARNCGFRR